MENDEQIKNELSVADKKRLYILERLKEEWDLNTIKTQVSAKIINQWWINSYIDSRHQFNSILDTFKNEGLITSWETIDPDSSR
ncbi:MAG: hypothetical protein NT094_01225 [Candidatus Staskawiczbacteria bacterium]|nr:hypothetical protein [Candidatus Staskawiczbacteria bacterium]